MITLSKLAALAHVSVSTASKAFSMSSEVSEQTRETIFQIAREQGCFKKFFNAKYPKYVIAVICPEYKSHFYNSALSHLQERLAAHSCEVCVASTNFSAQTEADLLEYYSHYANIDGIIVINGKVPLNLPTEIPVATILPNLGCEGAITLTTDCIDAITEAIRHFLGNGITDIGFIGDRHTGSKEKLFLSTAQALSLDREAIRSSITEERFETGGYKAFEKYLESGHIPRAIFCAYDYMAIGAIRCACEHGLRVPEDVAIVGMDNIPENCYLNPPLSSIDFNMDKLCTIAADAIMQRMSNPDFALRHKVSATFHLRASAMIK